MIDMRTDNNMKSVTGAEKTCRSPRAIHRASSNREEGSGGFAAGGDRPPIRAAGASPFNGVLGRKDGFTLLEVLVAFVLLATTVTVILQLFSSGIKALSLSEDYATAVVRAESKMREIADNEQLAENAWSETSPEGGYRFDITVAKTYETRTKDLPMKILEINITMSWKMGGKDKSLILNTMKTVKPQV
jgi:general secretion pathway protein I